MASGEFLTCHVDRFAVAHDKDRERRLTAVELTGRLRALDALASGKLPPLLGSTANPLLLKGPPAPIGSGPPPPTRPSPRKGRPPR